MAIYQLYQEQKVAVSINEIWDFISNPKNLKKITPGYMGFNITSKNLPESIYPGMMIEYKVSPLCNINMAWLTEITHVKENEFFIDEQRVGLYKIWHHEHKIVPINEGVLMTDLVTYQPPFGFLGQLANHLIICKKLVEISEYRKNVLFDLFDKS